MVNRVHSNIEKPVGDSSHSSQVSNSSNKFLVHNKEWELFLKVNHCSIRVEYSRRTAPYSLAAPMMGGLR